MKARIVCSKDENVASHDFEGSEKAFFQHLKAIKADGYKLCLIDAGTNGLPERISKKIKW